MGRGTGGGGFSLCTTKPPHPALSPEYPGVPGVPGRGGETATPESFAAPEAASDLPAVALPGANRYSWGGMAVNGESGMDSTRWHKAVCQIRLIAAFMAVFLTTAAAAPTADDILSHLDQVV